MEQVTAERDQGRPAQDCDNAVHPGRVFVRRPVELVNGMDAGHGLSRPDMLPKGDQRLEHAGGCSHHG